MTALAESVREVLEKMFFVEPVGGVRDGSDAQPERGSRRK